MSIDISCQCHFTSMGSFVLSFTICKEAETKTEANEVVLRNTCSGGR